MTPSKQIIPYGFCHCGCGQRTNLAPQTIRSQNLKKGDPLLFMRGHNVRGRVLTEDQKLKMGVGNVTHGHTRAGRKSSTFTIWWGMMQRCYNPNRKYFHCYGGRGIFVCKRWHKFENFIEDMGERPHGLTIERMDNDSGYSPSNCKWATYKEQASNRRAPSV